MHVQPQRNHGGAPVLAALDNAKRQVTAVAMPGCVAP